MSISQVSPSSLSSSSTLVSPYAKTTETQPAATLQTGQDAQKTAKTAQTDTVTISQQALQQVSGNVGTPKPGAMPGQGNGAVQPQQPQQPPQPPQQQQSFSTQA